MAKLKEAAMKMKQESAMKKPLVGDQDKLNEGLKKAIKAAPSKMKEDSSMKLKKEDSSPAKRVRINPRVVKIEKDLKSGREMLAAKKNPGKPKRVGTSIYEDKYEGTGDTRSTRKAEKKFAKAEKKLAKGKFTAAERKVKKGRKTVTSMPSGPTTRTAMKMSHKSANKMKEDSAMKLDREKPRKEGGKGALRDIPRKAPKKIGSKKDLKPRKPGKKVESAVKQKMNMVKGPDGKMVPDFAVDGKGANDMKSGMKMVKAVRKEQKLQKIQPTQNPKTKKPVKPVMSEAAKKAKAKYEADLAKKKAKADAKAEAKRIEQENLAISRQRAKALGMTMKEYEKHLRSKMLKSQRKRIFGF